MAKSSSRRPRARVTRPRRTGSRSVARPSSPSPADTTGLAPGMQAITAYLAVANVAASIEFLERVMGFSRGVTLADADQHLRYAEMRHGASVVMLVRRGDATSPSDGSPALYAYVPDVDRALAQARERGAGTGEVEDKPWGDRVGTITDPDGYRWLLATFKKLVPFGDP